MMNSKTLIFGIIAGLASALLAAIALTRPGLLTLLIYVAAVPVFFASFSKGSLAGIIAAAIAILSAGFFVGAPFAAIIGLTIVGPAAYGGHLAGLSRQADDGHIYWYPLSEILFRLALAIIASYIAIGLWFGYDVGLVAGQIEQFIRQVLTVQDPVLSKAQESAARYNALFYATLLPLIIPSFTLVVLVWNMSLAEKLVRSKSTMKRPKDNIAADSGLPKMALVLFVVAVILAAAVPSLQSAAFVVAGTMGMAIAMIGLAVLHYFTWGRKGRNQILFLTYVMTIITSVPLLLFLIAGVAELTLYLRARDPGRMPPKINT